MVTDCFSTFTSGGYRFAVDRINEDSKKAIVSLLNKSIEVEYAFIFNYPRLIDQLVNIEPIT